MFGATPHRRSRLSITLHAAPELLQARRMFVIELTYKAPLEEIDRHMKEHVAFLKKYYAAGNFLVSGRQIPREGGIILAHGESKEQVRAIVEEDPFVRRKLAEYRIVEFRASQRADDIPKRIA
jgi:uncharacterized protein YciI